MDEDEVISALFQRAEARNPDATEFDPQTGLKRFNEWLDDQEAKTEETDPSPQQQ